MTSIWTRYSEYYIGSSDRTKAHTSAVLRSFLLSSRACIFIEHVLHRSALLFDACIEACPRCFDFLVPVLDNDKTPDEDDEDRGEEKSKNLRNRPHFRRLPAKRPPRLRRRLRATSTDTAANSAISSSEDRADKEDIKNENGEGEEEEEEGQGACPYSSVKSFFGMDAKREVLDLRSDYDGSEPPMIDDIAFLKSLVKAAQHQVGMPIAMLDWAEQKGECVGIPKRDWSRLRVYSRSRDCRVCLSF